MKKVLFLLSLTLCACSGSRKEAKSAGTDIAVNYVPSRKAYDGFEWKELSGAGLKLWYQANDDIRLIADSSLRGIVVVRNGDPSPHKVIQAFNLPNKSINDVIDVLRKSECWDNNQTCRFKEVESGRNGVKRFLMVPDGEYAQKIETEMKESPVPVTCNGWGVGNSGMRYFELYESNPAKAIFVEIGQDAPLFDETSIQLYNTDSSATKKSFDELYTLSGTLCIGHEVRSFKPDGGDEEFWIVDKTGRLNDTYDKVTKGEKNGKPVRATLKLEYNGVWDDGFAAEYSGVYLVREILSVNPL